MKTDNQFWLKLINLDMKIPPPPAPPKPPEPPKTRFVGGRKGSGGGFYFE